MTAPNTSPRGGKTMARIAHLVHSAAGLWFTMLLTLVLVTGTLAVFAPEMDQLVFPTMRAVPPGPDAAKINPGALYDAVVGKYPGLGITHMDTAAHQRYAPASTTVILPGNQRRNVSVDPYTGDVLGEQPRMTVQQFLMRLHAVLFQGVYGFYAVNFSGAVMLVAVVAGLFAYRRFWRGFLKRPRLDRGRRILLGDLHKLIAVWSLPFLLIIALSGTWYFYNFPLAHLELVPNVVKTQPAPPSLEQADLEALGPETPTPLSGAEIVDRVLAAYPDMVVTGLMPPANINMPFVVHGERGEYLLGPEPNAVAVNPYSGEIMAAVLSEDLSLGHFLFQGISQLHHGELLPVRAPWGARMLMKLVWFLLGAGACFLSVSGLLIFLGRTRQAVAGLGWRRAWGWVRPWGGAMGVFKYVNVLVLAAAAAGIILATAMGKRGAPPQILTYAPASAGMFHVALRLTPDMRAPSPEPLHPGGRVMAFPAIADGRYRDARSILIGVTGARGSSGRGVRVMGAEKIAFAPLQLPENMEEAELWVEITAWDGSVHRTQWPLTSGSAPDPS